MPVPARVLVHLRTAGVGGLLVLATLNSLSCSSQMPFLAGAYRPEPTDSLSAAARSQRNLEVFDAAWDLIYERYYDPQLKDVDWEGLRAVYRGQADTASTEGMLYGILASMTAALEDGHTRVQSPEAVEHDEENIDVGIGLRGEWLEGRYVVTEVSPGSPAMAAGVQPGWVLSAWEGIPFHLFGGRGVRYAVRKGQEVRLTFIEPDDAVQHIDLTGRVYPATDPQIVKRVDDRTLYIRFDRFSMKTAEWFERQLYRYEDLTGLVIDLRTNRGGQLSALKQILSHFYEYPVTVGEEIRRNGKSRPLRVSGSGGQAFEGTLAVLVDRHSQSAAEVFAAAVQETGRGVVVGRRTAGNVLVSHRQALPDGGELRISTHDYLTATGQRLEGEGVQPDVAIRLELEDLRQGTDRDLDMALHLIDALNRRKMSDRWASDNR